MSKRTTSELMPNIKPANDSLTPVTFWKEIQPIPERMCRFSFGGIKCRTVYTPSRHNQIHCPYHNSDVVVRLKYLKKIHPDLTYKEERSSMGNPRINTKAKQAAITDRFKGQILPELPKPMEPSTPEPLEPAKTAEISEVAENLSDKSEQSDTPQRPTLSQLQDEIHNWSLRNFGPVPNDSFDYEMICTILMIAESFGRCCHAALKTAENIRGDAGAHRQEYFRGISEIRQAINSGTVLQARDFYRIITKNGYRLSSLIGMWEESAEMLRAMYDGNDLEVSDAIGDMMVFFADFCGRNSRSLEDKFVETWDKVKKRDWQKNKLTGQA